jgi:hypothetical protein
MRISVRKRYARLIRLVAIANEEATLPSISIPRLGPRSEVLGWTTYTRTDTLVLQIRDALRNLAKARSPEKGEPWYPITLPATTAAAGVVVSSDGTILKTSDFFRDEFLPSVVGCNVKRIKVCPICDRLFVALRLDQPACSPKCGGVHRAREFRRKFKLYERNRKETPWNRLRKAERDKLRRNRK